MVKEFDEAAWALQRRPDQRPRQVRSSGSTSSSSTDKRPATTRTLDRGAAAARRSDQVREGAGGSRDKWPTKSRSESTTPADLDRGRRGRGLDRRRLRSLRARGTARRPRLRAGGRRRGVHARSRARSAACCRPTRASRGSSLIEIKPSALPTLAEVQGQGPRRRDPHQGRRGRQGRRPTTMAQAAKANFAAAAKAAGVDVKTTELITRGAALPEVGVSSGGRRRGLRAEGRRDDRPDRHRQRRGRRARQGAAGRRSRKRWPTRKERSATRAQAAARRPVLRRLHDQGARQDDHPLQRGRTEAASHGRRADVTE